MASRYPRSVAAALSLSVLWCAPAAAQTAMSVRKVADGVYAVLQPAALRIDDANSAVIVLSDGVLIVDTQNSPAGAREVLARVREITDKPVRWVVNTHFHGDHVQGNEVYRDAFPDAEFIAQESVREDMETRAIPDHEKELKDIPEWLALANAALASGQADGKRLSEAQKEQLRGRVDRRRAYLARIQAVHGFVLPTRTVGDTLTLRDGREVRLLHFAGHTRGDLVVWLPAEKILITGDLLDDLPYLGDGSPHAELETLRAFQQLGFKAIIPGHGAVREGGAALEHLQHVQALVGAIVTAVDAATRDHLNLDDTRKRVDLSAQRAWFVNDDVSARYWDFFTGEAVRRAWEEANGHTPS